MDNAVWQWADILHYVDILTDIREFYNRQWCAHGVTFLTGQKSPAMCIKNRFPCCSPLRVSTGETNTDES